MMCRCCALQTSCRLPVSAIAMEGGAYPRANKNRTPSCYYISLALVGTVGASATHRIHYPIGRKQAPRQTQETPNYGDRFCSFPTGRLYYSPGAVHLPAPSYSITSRHPKEGRPGRSRNKRRYFSSSNHHPPTISAVSLQSRACSIDILHLTSYSCHPPFRLCRKFATTQPGLLATIACQGPAIPRNPAFGHYPHHCSLINGLTRSS